MANDRKKVLDAALEDFLEKGLTTSSLDSVAERAGTEISVVRALFVDKDNLLKTVLEEITDPIVSAIAVAVEKIDNPAKMISECLRLMDQWLLDNPDYVQLIRVCISEGPEVLNSIYQRSLYPSEFFERLQGFIKTGKIRERDIFMVSLVLDSLMFFPHMVMPFMTSMLGDESEQEFHRRRRTAINNLFKSGLFSE